MAFQTPLDIAGRACQHLGLPRLGSDGFSEDSQQASEISFAYGKLRQAELRRNFWKFAIKKAALRAIDVNTMFVQPTLWSSTTTYGLGAIVEDETGYLWQSLVADNLNNDPANTTSWDAYCGPLTATLFDNTLTDNTGEQSASVAGYFAGEIVYKAPGDGTYTTWMSLVEGNTDDPAVAYVWSSTATYNKDDIVVESSVTYTSLFDLNTNNNPSSAPATWSATTSYSMGNSVGASDGLIYTSVGSGNIGHDPVSDGGTHWTNTNVLNPWTLTTNYGTGSKTWLLLDVALASGAIVYPIGSGPASQENTRNIYLLPANYLREAPRDPKAGGVLYLGAPSGLNFDDWLIDDQYIVTRDQSPIIVRFVADIIDVRRFDPMFCEGFAARIAMETGEVLTQSTQKVTAAAGFYKQSMSDARLINAIEAGPIYPPEDDYVACRY